MPQKYFADTNNVETSCRKQKFPLRRKLKINILTPKKTIASPSLKLNGWSLIWIHLKFASVSEILAIKYGHFPERV